MIEEKIARFRELLAKRDEIDAEMGALFDENITTPPQECVAAPKAQKTETAKETRKGGCTECGSPSRHKKDCTRRPPVPSIASIRPSIARFDLDDEPEEQLGSFDEE